MGNHDDIINLPHHQSKTRSHMTLHDRATQFALFASLTGYAEEVAETARLTDRKIELSESEIAVVNEQLQHIAANLDQQLEIVITHFVPDERKDGGAYIETKCVIKKFDEINHLVILTDLSEIEITNIYAVELCK